MDAQSLIHNQNYVKHTQKKQHTIDTTTNYVIVYEYVELVCRVVCFFLSLLLKELNTVYTQIDNRKYYKMRHDHCD